jgi:hypothetical protein
LGLDTVVLRESTLVAGSSSVGEEVRADRLDASLSSLRELANSLEVLVGSPVAGKGGEWKCHSSHRSHFVMCGFDVMERENSQSFFGCNIFFQWRYVDFPHHKRYWRGKSFSGHRILIRPVTVG